ncbi:MAG: hypothetical protein ACKOB1_04675 [Planctomycetia bacterium]
MDDELGIADDGQACGTCRFWKRAAGADPRAGWGQCRRMPPTLPEVSDEKLVHVGVWPHTDVADWCGEWEGS